MAVSLRFSAMLGNSLRQHKSLSIRLQRMSNPPHRLPRNPSSALAHSYKRDYPTERGSPGGVPSKVDGKAAILGNHKPAELLRLLAFTEPPPSGRHFKSTANVTALTCGHIAALGVWQRIHNIIVACPAPSGLTTLSASSSRSYPTDNTSALRYRRARPPEAPGPPNS